ncbi:hypothetical protein Mnod_2644 [Methylobacterium nodulans ORS 2060]|uniref:PilZ domain-containing protein n=1 Tax=Methylobacterium nodulans (strain LMG 21967 / CNCM I-2342 / ORS 2060) TaxID=460265 RepID=B8IE61_METNO|nr:hypothetical protein Mnod_2644 [Methylobacterium nodulans ORS 2060]
MLHERRRAKRTDAFKLGCIVMGDRALLIDCLVWNKSEIGAMLEVEPSAEVSEHFRLVVGSLHVDRACELRWRRGRKMGVRFVDAKGRTPLRSRPAED